jgi:hypothetical protein
MFREWCGSQGFSTSTNLSHVLMDGGVLSIPYDRLNEFYRVCVTCVKNGEHIFVVEQKTDIYNFFVDIDYKDVEALSLERIESLVKVICDKVHSLGGQDCLVSVSKPKMKDDQVKSGVHLNWPNFPVNQQNAVYLRKHIVNTLTTLYPTEAWEKIIDSSVYGNPDKKTKGSGFRMPWSHKKGKHGTCEGNGCAVCDNTGKLTEVPYLPVFMYRGQGPFKLMERLDHTEPSVEILWAATIRTESKESRIIEPVGTSAKKREGSFTREQTKNAVTDPEVSSSLETFIREHLEGQSQAKIQKIFKSDKGDAYFLSTDSSYCENTEGKHSSNHVWFLVDATTVSQKCFCRCDILRRGVAFCKDFTGTRHELPKSILDILYPIKKSDTIKKAIQPNVSLHIGAPSRLSRILAAKT